MDEQLGPVSISIRREKVAHAENSSNSLMQYQFRLIIRTSELLTLRGVILEDAIPNIKQSSSKNLNIKEVLEYVSPEIQINCLRLGSQNFQQMEEQLLKLDEQGLTTHYKVGVMYCKVGQSSEEEMYNNEEAGPAFQEFLDTIGKKVRLKGFDKYKAGLDNKCKSPLYVEISLVLTENVLLFSRFDRVVFNLFSISRLRSNVSRFYNASFHAK